MPELSEHLRTEGHNRALVKQAELIADVRRELGARSPEFSDKDIWQRGVNHGPFTPAQLAASLIAADHAADVYAESLAAELGIAHEHVWRVESMRRNGTWVAAPTFPAFWVGRRPSVRAVCEACGEITQEHVAKEPAG